MTKRNLPTYPYLSIFCRLLCLALFSGCSCEDDCFLDHAETWEYNDRKFREDLPEAIPFTSLDNQPFRNHQQKSLPFDLDVPNELPAEDERTLIVLLHEGAFVSGDKDNLVIENMAADFAERGYIAASLNYTKISWAGPYLPRQVIATALEDVRANILEIQRLTDVRPENTYVLGYSAGGILACHLLFSSPDEMRSYVDDDLWTAENPAGSSKPFDGIISVSGALMRADHADRSDLGDHALLMVHGDKDRMVPYESGGPFDRYTQQQRIDLNLIQLNLGSFGPVNQQLVLPGPLMTLIRDFLISDKLCGPGCIENKFQRGDELYVATIRDGGHNLVVNEESGYLTATYGKIVKATERFICMRQSKRQRSRRQQR